MLARCGAGDDNSSTAAVLERAVNAQRDDFSHNVMTTYLTPHFIHL